MTISLRSASSSYFPSTLVRSRNRFANMDGFDDPAAYTFPQSSAFVKRTLERSPSHAPRMQMAQFYRHSSIHSDGQRTFASMHRVPMEVCVSRTAKH